MQKRKRLFYLFMEEVYFEVSKRYAKANFQGERTNAKGTND